MRGAFAMFGRPQFLRAFHGWCVLAGFALWVAAIVFGWIDSVRYISHVSMAALILGSWSSWQASRIEVVQDEQIRNDDDT